MATCPVCGEGLDRYHETEVACRECGGAFCPDHRQPDAHDCEAISSTPTGTFDIQAPDGAGTARQQERGRPATGGRAAEPTAGEDDEGVVSRNRERAVVAAVVLTLYLLNVPLAAGPLESAGYGSPWLYAVPGALLAGYAFLGVASGDSYHVWTNVIGAVLFLSGVLVVFPAVGSFGMGATRNVSPHSAGYFLATGAPLLVYVAYRVRGLLLGR
jgi:hypothetical protein